MNQFLFLKNRIIRINKNILLFYYLVICLIIPLFKSFNSFRAYNLLSGDIILITDEGIKKLDAETEGQTMIHEYNLHNFELKYISFAQSYYDEENYLFYRIKQNIFIISYSSLSLINIITQNDISQSIVSIIPYQDKSLNNLLIICYLNANDQILLEVYTNIEKENEISLKNTVTTESTFFSEMTCELMYSPLYSNDLLTCFVIMKNFI